MEHYASEMDPEWGKRIDRTDRICRLKKKLASVPLSEFTAGELEALCRVMGVVHGMNDDPHDEQLIMLERHFLPEQKVPAKKLPSTPKQKFKKRR